MARSNTSIFSRKHPPTVRGNRDWHVLGKVQDGWCPAVERPAGVIEIDHLVVHSHDHEDMVPLVRPPVPDACLVEVVRDNVHQRVGFPGILDDRCQELAVGILPLLLHESVSVRFQFLRDPLWDHAVLAVSSFPVSADPVHLGERVLHRYVVITGTQFIDDVDETCGVAHIRPGLGKEVLHQPVQLFRWQLCQCHRYPICEGRI